MTTPALQFIGVALSSGDVSVPRGILGHNFDYGSTLDIDYFVSKGLNSFRISVSASNVAVDTPNVSIDRILELARYAQSKNATIALDLHDFGFTSSGGLIGQTPGSISEFASEWSKIARFFKDQPNVIFGLMNEPHDQSATQWLAGANAAIAAIRQVGATQTVLVPGSYWDGAWTWTTTDNASVVGAGIVDPAHNYMIDVHQYLDADGSGTSASVLTGSGSTRLAAATDWARANGVKLFLGEYGFASDASSLTEGRAMLDYIAANKDVWAGSTAWTAGDWWGDYMFSIEPTGLGTSTVIDKPQLAVITQAFGLHTASTSHDPSITTTTPTSGIPTGGSVLTPSGNPASSAAGSASSATSTANNADTTAAAAPPPAKPLTPISGMSETGHVSDASCFGTVEHSVTSNAAGVYALYEALLGRAPDPLGLESFTASLQTGASLTDVAGAILSSPERGAQPANPTSYVQGLYTNLLHRDADAGGLQFFTAELAQGVSQAQVAVQLATSTEAQSVNAPAFQAGVFVPDAIDSAVARLYYGVLERAPDAGGLQAFEAHVKQAAAIGILPKAAGGIGGAADALFNVANAMLFSSEYASTHAGQTEAALVDSLYVAALGRHADAGGASYFADQLAHGTSRAAVALQIAESAEAQVHLVGQIENGFHLVG